MNKTVLSMFFACSFLNTFSMEKDPCAAWQKVMAQACASAHLDTHALAQAQAEALQRGCRRTDMVASTNCKPFFDMAGALSLCPRLLAVRRGYFPVFDYNNCQYTKFFEPTKKA